MKNVCLTFLFAAILLSGCMETTDTPEPAIRLSKIVTTSGGQVPDTAYLKYNSDGVLEQITHSNGSSALFTYSNGKVVSTESRSSFNGIASKSYIDYIYDGDRLAMRKFTNSPASGNVLYSYDSMVYVNNRLDTVLAMSARTRMSRDSGLVIDRELLQRIVLKWKNGNIDSILRFDNRPPYTNTIETYTYDNQPNFYQKNYPLTILNKDYPMMGRNNAITYRRALYPRDLSPTITDLLYTYQPNEEGLLKQFKWVMINTQVDMWAITEYLYEPTL